MTQASVNTYDVQVTFDAATKQFSYSGDVTGGSQIKIATSSDVINFTLTTINSSSGSQATFASNPIIWTGQPEPSCAASFVSGQTTGFLQIDNTNTSSSPIEYGFCLKVMYDGQLYTSPDPTIINDPPGGGE